MSIFLAADFIVPIATLKLTKVITRRLTFKVGPELDDCQQNRNTIKMAVVLEPHLN